MVQRKASCSCGNVVVRCEGEPIRISMCHCLACQRRTGSVFAAQARWPSEHVTVTVTVAGEVKEWTRTGDDGGKITQRFCPTCGATVSFTIDTYPGVVAVPVGAFADPAFPAPTFSVYEARKHAWVRAPEAAERMD